MGLAKPKTLYTPEEYLEMEQLEKKIKSTLKLKELIKETRVEEIDPRGVVTYRWKRAGNARNELWDLLVYGHAAVEILAWLVCIEHFELENIDWAQFWAYCELPDQDGLLNRVR